ncbi:MAG: aspartate kinase [Candidatus Bathyarchaeota archaeon]
MKNAKTIVVKFGGSTLASSKDFTLAAEKIAKEVKKGTKIVVVVSALAGVTDQLLKTAHEISLNNLGKSELDEVLSMGERTATRLMSVALKALGLKVVGLDPLDNLWPIYTDSNYGNAEVLLDKTENAILEKIKPLIDKGYVVVIPGFIGLSPEGKVTTLGRGGSDITAMVLGRCLNSDEVIFVKDVGGILSADPKKVSNPEKINVLDAEEMYTLSSAGAKVLHPKALKYAKNEITVRVVGLNEDFSGGTIIKGEINLGLKVVLNNKPVSMITIVGKEISPATTLPKILSEELPLEKLLGLTFSYPSLILYIEECMPEFINKLHSLIRNEKIAKAIHSFEPLSQITISGHDLEETPGIIDTVVAPLSLNSINLYGLITVSSSVRLFIHWNDKEKAFLLIKESLSKSGLLKGG